MWANAPVPAMGAPREVSVGNAYGDRPVGATSADVPMSLSVTVLIWRCDPIVAIAPPAVQLDLRHGGRAPLQASRRSPHGGENVLSYAEKVFGHNRLAFLVAAALRQLVLQFNRRPWS